MTRGAWVGDGNQALLTDLYQLTMAQAYLREGFDEDAVFTLFCRRLPATRNYLLACGLGDVLTFLETVRFTPESIDYLSTISLFSPAFLDWLAEYRFTGDVYAVPEGTPVFGEEPILEVVAPIAEAQLLETFVMNQVHLQTVLASKAARVVEAAAGRPVFDFGLRRMHGADAGLRSVRAFHIAGLAGTSNVLGGRVYGVPVAGTMAHSYIQAHDSEVEAFRCFAELYPRTTLLVDTYDTLAGVDAVIALATRPDDPLPVRAVRLDSGDLRELSIEARKRLDAAGLRHVEIVASGSLDEHSVRDLLDRGAAIDAFGVGTRMGVSADAPSLDLVYKLSEYAGRGKLKMSPGKRILPGRKQVYRVEEEGVAARDVIARWEEEGVGRPLLRPVMRAGKRLPAAEESLDEARERARREIALLPTAIRGLERPDPPYPVEISAELASHAEAVSREVAGTPARSAGG